MKIGFITPEFESEYLNGGGLGSYLGRICRVLLEQGHSPEVFVTSQVSERVQYDGILVHRVGVNRWDNFADVVQQVGRWLPKGSFAVRCSAPMLTHAAALAKALKVRERETVFDFVQSADFRAVGMFVPSRQDRPHIIRCSCAADLWSEADGREGFNPWQCRWERRAIRRADKAYAPSRLVADHYFEKFGLDVGVIRPPFSGVNNQSLQQTDRWRAYGKFHLHFGQFKRRKGTEFLADALPLVWHDSPDYRMVWAGSCDSTYWNALRSYWGDHASQVNYVGPLDKQELYGALSVCDAAVLPSLVDNLPNTVIESLAFNKPVIGTFDSSVDELVADGANGCLVRFGDVPALANAISESWHHARSFNGNLMEKSPIWDAMQPERAVQNLLNFATSPGSSRSGFGQSRTS